MQRGGGDGAIKDVMMPYENTLINKSTSDSSYNLVSLTTHSLLTLPLDILHIRCRVVQIKSFP